MDVVPRPPLPRPVHEAGFGKRDSPTTDHNTTQMPKRSKQSDSANPDLSTAELEVLKVLWDHGPLTVREVLNHLHESGRELAYTTVLTFLNRLEQKKCVASDKTEVAYIYRPQLKREKVTQSKLKSLITELYDGSATPLVLQLMKSQRFSAEEIEELQQHLDSLEQQQAASKKTRGRKKRTKKQ